MGKLTGALGILTAVLAIADLIHGQHNGDIYRTYIHVPEFIFAFAFLCLVGFLLFRSVSRKINLNRWIVFFFFAIVFGVVNFVLFAMSGGSFHGDGGPIAFSFGAISAIAEVGIPVALVGFIASAIVRKNAGFPVLRR